MQIDQFVRNSRERLRRTYPSREADTIVGIVCEQILRTNRFAHITNPGFEISPVLLEKALKAVDRLVDNEPIQYVLGYAEFYSRSFRVTSDVLIPRPETEELCSAVIQWSKTEAHRKDRLRILDLCTGSGCIAWTLAMEISGCEVVGIDISDKALEIASSQTFLTDNPPVFYQADILDDNSINRILENLSPFDVIVSNPPYILHSESAAMRANVLDYEPHLALFVPDGNSQLFNRAVAKIGMNYSNEEMFGIVEINESLADSSGAVFEEYGYRNIGVIKDASGKNRFVSFKK